MTSLMTNLCLVVATFFAFIGNAFGTESVSVTSTLGDRQIAVPQQEVIFTCTARSDSNIIHWSSNEYIGPGGDRLDLLSVDCVGSNRTNGHDPNTYATCTSVTVENGQTIFVSTLRIIATLQHPTASVTCRINTNGPHSTTTFQTRSTSIVDSSTTVYEVTTSMAHPTSHTTTLDVTVVSEITKEVHTLVIVTSVIAVSVILIIVVTVIAIITSFLLLFDKGNKRWKSCYTKVHDEERSETPMEVNKVHVIEEEFKTPEGGEKTPT